MKNILTTLLCVTTLLSFSQEKETSTWSTNRPDGHAPISIMGDHIHHKGELMFSYRYMTMSMKTLRGETKDLTASDAHTNYMVAPIDMDMQMHMLGFMYAPSSKITLMVMVNYLENNMALEMRNGTRFETNTLGFGDLKLSALYGLFNKNRQAMHLQLGLSIPTGSIEEKDVIPMSMGSQVQLPYPMQTGTGSFGAKIGWTYLLQRDKFSWGHQLTADININDNNQDYKFGNQYRFNNWLAAQAGKNLSVSVRVEGVHIDGLTGRSTLLNPMMIPTADTKNSGGSFVNSGFGLNYLIKSGTLKGLRFASEMSTPIYQNLNGIQLKHNYNMTFGLQYAID